MKKRMILFVFILSACTSTPKNNSAQSSAARNQAEAVKVKSTVKTTVKSILPQVKECYAEALKQDDQIKGRVTTSFEIDDRGKVNSCGVKAAEFSNLSIESCICQRITKATFSPAPKGKMARVDYPLVFNYR